MSAPRIHIDHKRLTHHFLTTDCTGAFQSDGITGKTRVDQASYRQGTSTVRKSDQASTSIFHQGLRFHVAHEGRMYGCNLFL
jgi:hypothetical protein